MDLKDAYLYENHIQNLANARIRIIPTATYATGNMQQGHTTCFYTIPAAIYFMENVRNLDSKPDIEDFCQQKIELSDDRVKLILNEIMFRDRLRYENLNRLYEDLFRVDQWRAEISFPQNYLKDRTWSDLNRMELQLREQIRRETKDFAKDTAFPTKDLREGLLEFKLQNQKSKMMEIGGLDDVIESDDSFKTNRGGYDPPQQH
jgi:hypothetical protein